MKLEKIKLIINTLDNYLKSKEDEKVNLTVEVGFYENKLVGI